jgi:hypothetical protein
MLAANTPVYLVKRSPWSIKLSVSLYIYIIICIVNVWKKLYKKIERNKGL